jgi:hypothetical protein
MLVLPMDTVNRTVLDGTLYFLFRVAVGIINFRKALSGNAENPGNSRHTGLATKALVLIYIKRAMVAR